MSNWISVKQELPTEHEWVLIFSPRELRGIAIASYRPESENYRWDCDTYGHREEDVSHWQRLPSPPEPILSSQEPS